MGSLKHSGSNNMRKAWVTKSEGIINEIDDSLYSNEKFIESIKKDDSPLGKLMQSSYPSSTTIRIQGGNIPPHWTQWDVPESLDEGVIKEILTAELEVIGEIPYDERIWKKKIELSDRINHLAKISHYQVTHSGIKDAGMPDTIEECVASIVSIAYMLLEKNTVSTMKKTSKKKPSIPQARRGKFNNSLDIVEKGNISNACLINAYVEPSIIMRKRLFCVMSLYGNSVIQDTIDRIYFNTCSKQVESIKKMMDEYGDKN